METLDKLIPLAIVIAVGAMVVFLLRRSPREAPAMIVGLEPVIQVAVVESAPQAIVVAAPVVVERKSESVAPPIDIDAPPSSPETPITNVLELLKKKDALATAFLLREILAPPVSKR